MRRTGLALLVMAGLLLGLFGPVSTASAAPARGYTAATFINKDPKNAEDTTTSFTPADELVCAWFAGKSTEGSPAKDFEVEIEFYTPGGVEYQSEWLDSNKLTFSEQYTNSSIARKVVKIAGTDAANELGEWSVKFYVNGELFKILSFTLSGTQSTTTTTTGTTVAVTDVQAYLEAQGYTVHAVQEDKADDGTPYALVSMDMASQDLYSSEVSNQLYHGYYALRSVYPNAKALLCGLAFGGQYEVLCVTKVADWDKFYAGGKWEDFASALRLVIIDLATGKALEAGEAKNFMTKNFGTGGQWNPPNVKPGKGNPNTGLVSSVQVEVAPSTLPADGKSAAQVKATVYGKDNKPLADMEVEFTLSGAAAAGCRIRPTTTATDSKGEATATFTAGTASGKVNVTAQAKSATGLAVVTVGGDGGKSTDPKADEVIAALTKAGYKVHGAGVVPDEQGNPTSNVAVIMDMASNAIDNVTGQQLALGWTALYQTYPDATGLFVVLYYDRYSLIFSTTAADFAAVLKAGDEGAIQAFWNKVFSNLIVVDRTTGEQVKDTKGFIQKNFAK